MKTIISRLRTLGLGFATIFLCASSPAEALQITDVRVTIGPVTYTKTSVGWDFGVSGVNLNPGEDLVLTQDFQGTPDGVASYNFDTSDDPSVINPNLFPLITITANGVQTTFTDTNQVLNVKSRGPVGASDNEAQLYGAPLVGPGYQLFLGYADNVHNGVCGQYASSLLPVGLLGSSTCFPTPFGANAFPRFQGRGGPVPIDLSTPGVLVPEPNDGVHCAVGQNNCYDAGVIRIVASPVPEPATMTLLLTGLGGFAARRYRQSRKTA